MPTGNTQQVINYGASANDGQGDPLRTAFIKTDDNFDNVWLAGPVGSNVRITNNTIGVIDTNGNLILSPNGVGVIQTNNNIVPRLNRTYDLGTANLTYRTVYANTATFQTLGLAGDLSVGGNLTVSGNIIQVGNIVTETLTIQLANAATTANAANGSGITVGASDNIATLLYNSASNVWTTNIGLSAVGNVTAPYFIGNGSQLTGIISSYGNSNVTVLLSNLGSNVISGTGNITTTGNISGGFILGNISQATGFPATYGNANVANYLPTFSGNITGGNISATGNITGNYFIGDGSQLTGLSTNSISNGNSNVNIATVNGPVTVSYAGSGNTWTFGDVSVPEALYWPDGSFQATAFVGIAQDLANPGNATITSNNTGNTTYAWNFGTDGRLTFPGTPRIATDSDNFEVQAAESINFEANAVVNIYTDTSGTTYQWQFGDDGNLTLPGGGSIIVDGSDGVIGPDGDNMVISWDNEDLILRSLGSDVDVEADRDFNIRVNYDVGATDYLTKWIFGQDNEIVNITGNSAIITEAGNLNLQGGRNTLSSGNVQITAVDNGVAVNTWTFDNTGNLTVPGNIVMPPGASLVGNGASPAPSISGFSSATFGANVTATGNITGGNIITTGNVSGNTAGYAIGYRDIPQVSFAGDTTIATTDAGKHYYSVLSTGNVLTIANNASQGFQVGAAITVVNQGTGNITVAQGSGVTLYLAGNATSGNRSVATFGMATIMKVDIDTWFINGTGVS